MNEGRFGIWLIVGGVLGFMRGGCCRIRYARRTLGADVRIVLDGMRPGMLEIASCCSIIDGVLDHTPSAVNEV